jgi:hypothetical protein
MAPALRRTVLATCALLWLSGVLWLALHFGFAQPSEFGALPNPWEPAVMRLHGVLAVLGVFLLGWMAGGHVWDHWRLAGSATLLIASGYALYYTTGPAHDLASLIHEWLGVASLAAALAHWWRIPAAR